MSGASPRILNRRVPEHLSLHARRDGDVDAGGGSHGEVSNDAMAVVHADYKLPCAVNIHVPNHEEAETSVEAEVLFDCGPEV